MSPGRQRPPDDPVMREIGKIAEKYGDQELLRVCVSVVAKYAQLGARKALVNRRGDKSIECETCRERKAQVEQFEKNMRAFTQMAGPLGTNPNEEG